VSYKIKSVFHYRQKRNCRSDIQNDIEIKITAPTATMLKPLKKYELM
jgi:hypothetical protein